MPRCERTSSSIRCVRMTRMNPSRLRSDIYRVLDQVIETGEPVEILRNGRIVRIVADPPPGKLSRLVKRPGFIRGEPKTLVDIEWSKSWKP